MSERIVEVNVDGTCVFVRARSEGGIAAAAAPKGVPDFDNVFNSIEAVAKKLAAAMASVRPDKARLAFTMELTVKGGVLVSVLCGAEAKGGIEIEMEWQPGKSG